MSRILILSDSLTLPRKEPESTLYEETWPALLSQQHQVFQFSKGGGIVKEIAEQAHYYSQYEPDIVILQYGIVDCAPRAYTHNEEYLFNMCLLGKVLRKLLSKTITTRRLRRIRKKVYTPAHEFEKQTLRIVSQFPKSKVYVLGILPPSAEYEKLVPGVSVNVKRYNLILEDCISDGYIDTANIPLDGIMSDFHHLTKSGHSFIYTQIMTRLNGQKK